MGHPGVSSTQWSLHTRWAGPGVRTQRQHRPVLIFFLFFSRNCSAPALGQQCGRGPERRCLRRVPVLGRGLPPGPQPLCSLEPWNLGTVSGNPPPAAPRGHPEWGHPEWGRPEQALSQR